MAAKTNGIRENVKFQGTWRSYQDRVLKKADKYLADGKVHIVAAPGSGKTTLGIELIARKNKPCLILAPSITIRDQWISRIKEGFGTSEEMLSNNIKEAAPITAITYQALHSCIKRLKDKEEDETGRSEEVDYRDFDFYGTIRKMGFMTLCLDEAHHLRSEWQKALEEVVEKLSGCTIISLTATPPYDSTPAQWQRYISLCGPIDEEIIVPELVKEGSLCPHQDYVYFNFPTEEEEKTLTKFRAEAVAMQEELWNDEEFTEAIASHKAISEGADYTQTFLDEPDYLASLLIFCQEKNIAHPAQLSEALGENTQLPGMNLKYFGTLLQGFLFDDTAAYTKGAEYRESLINRLKARGLIHKSVVELSENSEIDKMLITSKGKLQSITSIVDREYKSLGEGLRLLILTDYIRKEYLGALGDEESSVQELGVVPIFENVRRCCIQKTDNTETSKEAGKTDKAAECKLPTDKELRLAALSGTIVILPEVAKEAFKKLVEESGQKATLRQCGAAGYYQASISGSGPAMTVHLTELFKQGYIRVLVGTKSLLGEGWDSPCINALILASFVGSYMLSNQMRGRAIRIDKNQPQKASNIWHLICMEPSWLEQNTDGDAAASETKDFVTLQRRFEGFLGVNYDEDTIENGMDRLTFIRPPYGREEIDTINEKMCTLAEDRAGLRDKWQRALEQSENIEVADLAGAEENSLRQEGLISKTKLLRNGNGAGSAALLTTAIGMFATGNILLGGLAAGAAAYTAIKSARSNKLLKTLNEPEKYMESIGQGVLSVLRQTDQVETRKLSIGIEPGKEDYCCIYLEGGTEREKSLFSQVVSEFFSSVANQRYLLKASGKSTKDREYYCVPELFAKKKEDAELFRQAMEPYIGQYELIFTRSEAGKKELLQARVKAFADMDEKQAFRKKQVRKDS